MTEAHTKLTLPTSTRRAAKQADVYAGRRPGTTIGEDSGVAPGGQETTACWGSGWRYLLNTVTLPADCPFEWSRSSKN